MNIFIRLANKNKEVDENSWLKSYEAYVEQKVAERYTIKQELSILRKRDTNPAEFAEYNEYVEQCKAEAKALFGKQ
jgi:hypothetical protein